MTTSTRGIRAHDHDDHDDHEPSDPAGCEHCPLTVSRRTFLSGLAIATLGSLGAGAASPALAEAVRSIRPRHAAGMLRTYRIPPADGVSIDEADEVILVRWQQRAYAFSSRCTHRGARLRWREDEGRIFCPKHKARFRPDGGHDSGRRARDLDRYAITRRGDSLVVDLDRQWRADTDRAAWAAAVVAVE